MNKKTIILAVTVYSAQAYDSNRAGPQVVSTPNVWCDHFKRKCEIYDKEKADIIDIVDHMNVDCTDPDYCIVEIDPDFDFTRP